MPAWKRFACFCFVFSPAALVMISLAPAAGPGMDRVARISDSSLLQFAQNAAEQPAASEEAASEEAVTDDGTAADEGPAEFTDAFLNDPAHIDAGKVVWEVCAGCHGARAYPGKAPKLRPKKYTPEFVFDRVTNGYKKMPAWKDVFTREERMDVVAWILSDDFAP